MHKTVKNQAYDGCCIFSLSFSLLDKVAIREDLFIGTSLKVK